MLSTHVHTSEAIWLKYEACTPVRKLLSAQEKKVARPTGLSSGFPAVEEELDDTHVLSWLWAVTVVTVDAFAALRGVDSMFCR